MRVCLFILLSFFLAGYYSCQHDFSALSNSIDTTSHDFHWETITLDSPYGSGVLNDVAILEENDIWAVGEIYSDSTQPSKRYNAVHWNGSEWELKRIPYVYNGQPYYHPLNFSFSFENGEVWFGGNGIVKWDGNNYTNVEINQNVWGPVSINKIWGSSTSNVFIVGNEGSMAHYNGSSWQKLESGTDVDFRDIWGCRSSRSGEWEILAVTSYGAVPSGDISILKIEGTTVHSINTTGLPSGLSSIWFIPGQVYYAVGDGVFRTSWPGRNWQAESGHPALYKVAIRGQSKNDIFITGSYGLVSHYNGKSWHHYNGSELPTIYGGYWSISYKEDLMVAVGDAGVNGIILRGTRKE